MTAKEIAFELVYDTFRKATGTSKWDLKYNYKKFLIVKKCAKAAVQEILKSEQTAYPNQEIETGQVFIEFWNNVKTEIEKL